MTVLDAIERKGAKHEKHEKRWCNGLLWGGGSDGSIAMRCEAVDICDSWK